jgi:hypothetical protein
VNAPEFAAEPWRPLDVKVLIAGQVVGLGLVLVAWIAASDKVRPGGQTAWLNFGIVGATVAVATGLRFVGRGRRAVAARRGTVAGDLRLRPGRRSGRHVVDLRSPLAAAPETVLVSSERMTRYHRAGCQLTAGKALVEAPRRGHEAAGRQPCGVCEP